MDYVCVVSDWCDIMYTCYMKPVMNVTLELWFADEMSDDIL